MKTVMLSVESMSSVATRAKQALSGKLQGDYISFASLRIAVESACAKSHGNCKRAGGQPAIGLARNC